MITNEQATPPESDDSTLRRSSAVNDGRNMMAFILLFFATGALAVFLLSLTGRFFFYGELLGNFRLQLAILLLPFALIVFLMRRWAWLGYCLTFAIAWSIVSLGSVYLPAKQPQAGPKKLKVMSFNVLGYNHPMRDEVIAEIHKPDPDVLVLLEYNHHWHRRLDILKAEYPYHVLQPRWHGFGLAIFSKLPLSDTEVIQLTHRKTDNPAIITNVTLDGQKFRLCGVHALSPTNAYRLDLRNRQYNEIADKLLAEDVPTVVMGDFNSVPWSPFLADFMKKTGYRDSRRGFGYHASWHAEYWPIRIPIDHAFVSNDICVHSRTRGGFAGSDHLPIIFEISTAK